ncbi:homoserine O-acetyltransferase [Geoalkalibacter ferrihydriticus]|uniref:Homoserine O-acetyltransferase n=2 Tax=Geoalkalibacter ferrihydriticus TaxID=392333 RepID=A0A0C2HLA5_9BACT|nr:homoserine O-acetyltransferase [Geoalkalibacter ferrihydriticus]KIH77856.1 homoserine acetyltransferase [Geoalkalibacter ferrihydriticus DSM 17813]SDL82827.1 homoserine O-acetyltransferase [Geoalkalibacter ferrihydriticus]
MTSSVGIVTTQQITFDTELQLESGRVLGPITLAYETYGSLNAARDNAILVCHAWTGDAHAAGRHHPDDRKPGWWDDMIGPGKVLDTDRYFILCSNVIGSCKGSTGPASINPRTGKPYRLSFPVLMVRDMVRAQKLLIDHLGLPSLLCALGGSMGAMQAVEWSILYPDRVRSIVPIAGTARTSPMAIALNAVARQAVFNDPLWKKGNYRAEHPPADGLALARAVGHISFLSDASMHMKFGRRFSARDGQFDFFGKFEIERYLEYNGYNFPARFDTNSFLYLAKALDLYDTAWNFDSLDEALNLMQCPSLWFAFTSDWLYPPYQTEEAVRTLEKLGKPVGYHLIDSDYGHDSFLVEPEKFTHLIADFLAQQHS